MNEAIGDDEDIAATKGNIAIAQFIYEGASNNEELLKANEELYELRVAKHGEDDFILWERWQRAEKISRSKKRERRAWNHHG